MNPNSQTDKIPKFNRVLLATSCLFALLIILVVAGIISGRIYIGLKQPGQSTRAVTKVCDADDIARFNRASSGSSKDASLDSVIKSIQSRKDYQKDATCVYMAFYYYQLKGDAKQSTKYYNLQDKLAGEKHFPSNKLNSILPLKAMDGIVNTLKYKGKIPIGEG